MRRLIILLILLVLFPFMRGDTASVTIDTAAEWTAATVSNTDMEAFSSGLKLRQTDSIADYRVPHPRIGVGCTFAPATRETSSDVPSGAGYSLSRHYVSSGGASGFGGQQAIYYGLDSAVLQPSQVTYYTKEPYHSSGVPYDSSGKYYVTVFEVTNMDGPQMVDNVPLTWRAQDCHAQYGAGRFSFGGSDASFSNDFFSWITDAYGSTEINNVWIKTKVELDWANTRARYYLDDTLQNYMRRYDSGGITGCTDESCYTNQTVTNGWINFYGLQTLGVFDYTRTTWDRFNFWLERAGTADPGGTQSIDYKVCTSMSKWRIQTGSWTGTIPTSSLSDTITSATLSWVASNDTDSNLTTLASRAWNVGATCTASTEATGHEAGDAIEYEGTYHERHAYTTDANCYHTPTYWRATSSTGQWWKCDLGSAKVPSWITVAPYATSKLGSPNTVISVGALTIKASNDDSTYTTLWTGTYDNTKWSVDYKIATTTAYRYIKLEMDGANSMAPGLFNVEIREWNNASGTTRTTAADWTSTTVQYRYTTDGTTPTGSWTTATSGSTIYTGSVSKSDFVLQVKAVLATDNQKYLPVIESLTLVDQDGETPSSPASSTPGGIFGWH